MTKAKQMNGHRADERSSSSGSATSRRRTCNGERRRPARNRVTENDGRLREKSSGSAARKKAREVERVQVELKETEMKRRSKEGRRRDCTRMEEARAIEREKTYSPTEAHHHWVIKRKNWASISCCIAVHHLVLETASEYLVDCGSVATDARKYRCE
ncbi:hypothetical protein M9H77_20539 [Catharanthus roseus]|uniref:Uncharacterized protein n=1 Tax=Catharanthus roseus TaxID=4058 RepID=A0ACC0AP10_CATRO|nr:hypothetical protein M9H77_20539 [Catharanthus roseus]